MKKLVTLLAIATIAGAAKGDFENWERVLQSSSTMDEGWAKCIVRLVEKNLEETEYKDIRVTRITNWTRFTPFDFGFEATDGANHFSGSLSAQVEKSRKTAPRTGAVIWEGYHCGYYKLACGSPDTFYLRNLAGEVIFGGPWKDPGCVGSSKMKFYESP